MADGKRAVAIMAYDEGNMACKYCDGSEEHIFEEDGDGYAYVRLSHDGMGSFVEAHMVVVDDYGDTVGWYEIGFCPKCGREL
jgi:hypothetical protein